MKACFPKGLPFWSTLDVLNHLLFLPGFQSVLPNQQQGFQGLMGMQHPPQSQNLMNNQQGNQVQGMMVQYPAMSSYQVPRHFTEFLHFGEHIAKRKANDVMGGGVLLQTCLMSVALETNVGSDIPKVINTSLLSQPNCPPSTSLDFGLAGTLTQRCWVQPSTWPKITKKVGSC